jgi:uncharacterized protein YndB with AHSA1/START domain
VEIISNLIAKATIVIDAPLAKVWDALLNPDLIEQYMFGARVVSDWKEGSTIVWKGEWEGTPYEDKGTILQIKPEHIIEYSHYSPISGKPDVPENYHKVLIKISPYKNKTKISLTQNKNETKAEKEHSEKNWQMMLNTLKELMEKDPV